MATAAFQSVIPNLLPLRFPRVLENLLSRALGIQEVARVYDALRSMGEQRPIADRLVDFLGVAFTTSDVDRRIRSGVRFLANGNLDPKFANVLSGLTLVDLTTAEPELLDRYLGAARQSISQLSKRTKCNTLEVSFG